MDEQLSVLRSILPSFEIDHFSESERLCISLAEDDDSSWDDLHEALLSTPEITKSIIVWASCLNERLSRRSGDFFAILTGLGRSKLPGYIYTALLFERMKGLSKAQPTSKKTMIGHSILTSIIASYVGAEFDELNNPYLIPAALSHDIGHLLMPVGKPRLRVVESDTEGEVSSSWARPETDHSQLGALFLEALQTPNEISASAKEHHNISNNESPYSSLVATVRCADIIAEAICLENSESQSNRCLAKLKNDFIDHPFSQKTPLILTYLPEWAERGLESMAQMETLLFNEKSEEVRE